MADNYDTIIDDAATEWNLDPRLLKALILHESGGNPMAVSKAGAQGLGQIMPETQRQLGVTAPHDPVQSIYGAAKYLSEALDKEGTPDKALLYYHGGPGWRQNFGPESRGYVPGVTAQYVKLAPKEDAAARVQVAQATPTVMTDASPGKPMASDDVLKLLPPAPKAGGVAAPVQAPSGGAGTGQEAAPGGSPLDLLPPAPKPSATTAAAVPAGYTDPEGLGRPEINPLDVPASSPAARISLSDIRTALQPAPNTEYGNLPLSWVAKDTQTGDVRFAMPNALRAPLLELFGGGEGGPGMTTTVDPATGEMKSELSPLAGLLMGGAATPLRFSGANPLARVPPGTFDTKPAVPGPITLERLNQAVVNASPETWRPVGPAEEFQPGREYRMNQATGQREVKEGGPVGGQTPPSAAPAGEKPPGTTPEAGGPQPGTAAKPEGALPPLSPEDHQWVSGVRDRVAEIQQENQAAGIPGSVGAAATPEELARLTPAQMKAYRKQAELGEVLAPPVRGMDKNIYVHGSEPTLAEYSGDAAVSQKESLHRERAPNQFDERLRKNTQARVDSYEKMEGTAPQLQDLRDAKAAAAEKDGAAYMRVAKDLDYGPAVRWLDEKIADPRVRESPERMRVLSELRGALFDEKGALKTDPGSGWGMHDNLIDRLDKAGDRTAAERYATKLLVEYKKIIDGVNNAASDGAFQTFLDNQSKFAADINSMEELQKFRPKLTNRNGDINATAFHKFVTDLAIRRARPGVDPAMGISDETMRGLIMIDKDLKRASNIDLGKARGSNTNLLFALAQAGGIGAAHLAIAAATEGAPLANLMLHGALKKGGELTGNVMLRRAVRRGLNPPPGGYDYGPVNPLDAR